MFEVALILFDGFETIEALFVADVLRNKNKNINLTLVGYGEQIVTSWQAIKVTADKLFEDVANDTFDCIIFPGGKGSEKLEAKNPLHDFIKRHYDQNKWVCAICAAPCYFLKVAGVLENANAVCYPTLTDKLGDSYIETAEKVYVDKDHKIITAKGPGAAADFAISIVQNVTGSSCISLRESMLLV